MSMNPNQSVRIKYRHDDEILCRKTGSVVPRVDETVMLYEEDETGVPVDRKRYIVDGVGWSIANTAERKPDVVTVDLITKEEREEKFEQYKQSIGGHK